MAKKFVFRSNQVIGNVSAESDSRYLSSCFISTGDLEILKDCEDPRNILVGRTGSGKSALILRLAEEEDHVIQISPESLSLSYIANSDIIRFFYEAGVKMDLFFKLLWKHIFCVEFLKERFKIDCEEKKKTFFEKLWGLVPRNKEYEIALDYVEKWGESYWREPGYRIQEVTTKFETELRGSVEGKVPNIAALNVGAAKKLSEEQKAELTHDAQDVVNSVQIKQLSDVMKLIGKVLLDDPQQRYYITIDGLDENWVEDALRFRLIRALIETSVEFTRINSIKVIVSIRSDLLDRVYRETRGPGFQEEKFQSCSLNVSWARNHLIEVLDKRIDYLVKEQYTSQVVTHKDLLPKKIREQLTIDYMLERTFMRPRDIIQFFNACIQKADGKTAITEAALREADGVYSRDRLKFLFDEWNVLYPNLSHLFYVLKGRGYQFLVKDLSQTDLDMNALQLVISGNGKPGLDYNELIELRANDHLDFDEYRREIVYIFYKVGLVGLKTGPAAPISWSHMSGVSVSSSEITETTKIQIHKAFWRVLGVYDREEPT